MEDLANVILSKLIVYGIFIPDPEEDDISKEDLKYMIYDLFNENNYVNDLINKGYNVDMIINDDELMEDIIDLSINSDFNNDIDEFVDPEFIDLLNKNLSETINQ